MRKAVSPIALMAVDALSDLGAQRDTRTLCDRVADILSESHREDTTPEFRLGLLQGALAIALPQLHKLEPKPKRKVRANRRSRRNA